MNMFVVIVAWLGAFWSQMKIKHLGRDFMSVCMCNFLRGHLLKLSQQALLARQQQAIILLESAQWRFDYPHNKAIFEWAAFEYILEINPYKKLMEQMLWPFGMLP